MKANKGSDMSQIQIKKKGFLAEKSTPKGVYQKYKCVKNYAVVTPTILQISKFVRCNDRLFSI